MNRTDNFASTFQALALFILNNAPTACRQERELQHIVSEGPESHRDTLYLDFRGPDEDCDASLQVSLDFWHGESVSDETGYWSNAKLKVKVSWPSWGSTETALASKRLALMVKVAELGKALEKEFGGLEVWRQVYTPEQVAEQERSREERRIRTLVDNRIEAHCKHMRVGSHRDAGIDQNIPNGRYESTLGDKKYYVQVYGNGRVDLTRTA